MIVNVKHIIKSYLEYNFIKNKVIEMKYQLFDKNNILLFDDLAIVLNFVRKTLHMKKKIQKYVIKHFYKIKSSEIRGFSYFSLGRAILKS